MKDRSKDFVENNGWSANKFAEKLPQLKKLLKEAGFLVVVGRTVAHLTRGNLKIKIYPHYKGMPNTTLSAVMNNVEQCIFQHTETPQEIVAKLLNLRAPII